MEVIVSASKSLHDYGDGAGRLVVETLTDVTALRQAETKLRESQAQFGSLVDTAADGFVIASSDGQIQSVNRAMLVLFGYDRADELIGTNLRVLMPAGEAMLHAGHRRPPLWSATSRDRHPRPRTIRRPARRLGFSDRPLGQFL